MNAYEAFTLFFSAVSALGVGYEVIHRIRRRNAPRVRLVVGPPPGFGPSVLVVENDGPRPVCVVSLVVRTDAFDGDQQLADGSDVVPAFGRLRFETRGKILYSRLKCTDKRGRTALAIGEHRD